MSMRAGTMAGIAIVAACCGLIASGQAQQKKTAEPAKKANAKAAAPEASVPADDADVLALRASAEQFTKAYNSHSARAVAELFAPRAEIIDEHGELTRGREAIEKAFAEVFRQHPKIEARCEIASIRILTPNIGVEEGLVYSKAAPDEPDEVSSYVAVHVRVEGKWLVGSVRDFAAPLPEPTAHERLEELAWLVGEWVDESPQATVHSTCQWDESGNFLIQNFAVRIEGRVAMSGTMRIGWDAVSRQIRSWVFDSQGGHAEGYWQRSGDEWTVKTRGHTSSGEVASAVNVYQRIDEDTIAWRSFERTMNGENEDDIAAVTIKRRPPPPGK
ncbi:MAG: SgcJ/EcaC family oxidoreductase [Planctomycetia bacterium]|nr:SgcJ/EcaC family oxidoreductase [Planctomycetia bacterium]